MKTLCVFCGSLNGNDATVVESTKKVAEAAARLPLHLVCGGSNSGLMHVLIENTLANGGQITGVHPKSLIHHQPPHPGLSEVIHTDSLHDRKETMIRISDAFLILPGAYGTLDEWLEIMVLKKINALDKPIIVYNPDGFWDHTLNQFKRIEEQGFAGQSTREDMMICPCAASLIAALESLLTTEEAPHIDERSAAFA